MFTHVVYIKGGNYFILVKFSMYNHVKQIFQNLFLGSKNTSKRERET